MTRKNTEVENAVIVRELPCALNEAELLERGDAMAACESAVDELKAERRRLNASIREQSDRRGDLAKIIETKSETRDVSCEWKPDYKLKRYDLVRLDTSEEIEQRPMPESDMQMRLVPDEPTPITKNAKGKPSKKTAASKR